MDNGSEISNKTYSSDLGSKTEIVDGIEIKSERSTGKAIYSGAASLGRFLTMVFLFVAIFAGIIMVIYGIIVIRRRHNHSEKTQGTVVSASCILLGRFACSSGEGNFSFFWFLFFEKFEAFEDLCMNINGLYAQHQAK